MKVSIVKMYGDTKLPEYATEGSAGFDLEVDNFKQLWDSQMSNQKRPRFDETDFKNDPDRQSVILNPHSRLLVGTGLKIAVPKHHELQIRPRSGNALKKGLTVINTPGTIDSDYIGEVGVILINTSLFDVEVKIGDKVAQGILTGYCKLEWNEVDTLDETDRGEAGYGHSDNPIDPQV